MYSRPLTSHSREPCARLTTNARSSVKRCEPSTPPGRRRAAVSSKVASPAVLGVVAGVLGAPWSLT